MTEKTFWMVWFVLKCHHWTWSDFNSTTFTDVCGALKISNGFWKFQSPWNVPIENKGTISKYHNIISQLFGESWDIYVKMSHSWKDFYRHHMAPKINCHFYQRTLSGNDPENIPSYTKSTKNLHSSCSWYQTSTSTAKQRACVRIGRMWFKDFILQPFYIEYILLPCQYYIAFYTHSTAEIQQYTLPYNATDLVRPTIYYLRDSDH